MQLSCVNSVCVDDINNDGFPDLIMGGNQFGFLPEFQRLDACLGDVLINNGKGGFTRKDLYETGLLLRGEVRDIQKIEVAKKNEFLILQNDKYPLLFKINK